MKKKARSVPKNPLRDLEVLVNRIRKASSNGSYRCLPSFLDQLAVLSWADSVGVFSQNVRTGKLRLWREATFGSTANHPRCKFEDLVERFTRILSTTFSDSFGPQTYIFDIVNRRFFSLVLKRIRPGKAWDNAFESFWIYVVNPRVVTPGTPKILELAGAISDLAVSWFHWKESTLTELSWYLGSSPEDLNTPVLSRYCVQPLDARRFIVLLREYRPPRNIENDPYFIKRWKDSIYSLLRGLGKCGCKDVNQNELLSSTCPQSDRSFGELTALAKTYLWRTEFWKLSPLPLDLLHDATEGLRALIHILESQVDFRFGGERTLLKAFVSIAIDQELEMLRAAEGGDRISDFHFVAQLADLAVVIVGDEAWTSDSILNLAYVIGEYGHRHLGVARRIDLYSNLCQTLRGESALYTLKQRYRDHFFHTIEVCLFGFIILRSHPDQTQPAQEFVEYVLQACTEKGPVSAFVPKTPMEFF